jgi:anaerobic selenocysteine-containing dehydrogenase
MEKQETNENERKVQIVRTASTFDCGGRCPLKLHIKEGKIIRVEGDIMKKRMNNSELVYDVELLDNMSIIQKD